VKAKKFFKASIILSTFIISVSVLVLYIFSRQAIEFFTVNHKVVETAMSVMFLAVLDFYLDMFNGYLQGPIRALGLQTSVIPYNLTAYWFISLPLTCILSFPLGLGFKGCFLAMLVAQSFLCTCSFWIILNADWDKAAS
jgi:Na+-driven multidrug efflux pump